MSQVFVARFYDSAEQLLISWAPFSADNLTTAYKVAFHAVLASKPGTTLNKASHVTVAPSTCASCNETVQDATLPQLWTTNHICPHT